MALSIVISMLLIAPYNFWQRTARTMFRADLKTVLISSSSEAQRAKSPPLSYKESDKEKKNPLPLGGEGFFVGAMMFVITFLIFSP